MPFPGLSKSEYCMSMYCIPALRFLSVALYTLYALSVGFLLGFKGLLSLRIKKNNTSAQAKVYKDNKRKVNLNLGENAENENSI